MGTTQHLMWKTLFAQHQTSEPTLQGHLRTLIVRAILDGVLSPGAALPSSRVLASLLGISRNTVTLAYGHLADQDYIVARPQSGFTVKGGQAPLHKNKSLAQTSAKAANAANAPNAPKWPQRLRRGLADLPNIRKPRNWQDYPYPFIYGQFDASLFPARQWRECAIAALRATAVRDWASDRIDQDDTQLVEQIQQRILPTRGIWASQDDILITSGAQQANYILAEILIGKNTVLGLEEPGYPDVRNIYSSRGARILPLPVDAGGLRPDATMADCDYVYATPSHQCPSTVSMSEARRQSLLDQARELDFVIIEDDYDSELSFDKKPLQALKGMDTDGRVIYVGSLSKTIAPGLRVGFMVADPYLIREARAARRLMMRHPPTNNERALALFLSFGHHDMLVRRLTRAYDIRLARLADAVQHELPDWKFSLPQGGSALWLQAPPGISTERLAAAALDDGVIIEAGSIFFSEPARAFAARHARLGIASIAEHKIHDGIRLLAKAARRIR